MIDSIFHQPRNSFMQVGEIYFWTATINSWQPLLATDKYKSIIVDSLNFLTSKGLIDVFAFVIMPNHIHLIWRINANNGKETPRGSFLKYTAHQFKKLLRDDDNSKLEVFRVKAANKDFEFWQRDPLAIHLFSQKVAFQKLDYIHNNPLAPHWNLATDPDHYYYSSARFYNKGENVPVMIKDIRFEM